MLKAEQVPLDVRNAISAARKNGASSAEIAAAAINAWPGVRFAPAIPHSYPELGRPERIILPLSKENANG